MFKKFKALFVVVVVLLSSFMFSSAVFAIEEPKDNIEAFDQIEPLMGDFLFKMHSKPFKLGRPENKKIYGYEFIYEGQINWPDAKYCLLYEEQVKNIMEYLYFLSPYDWEMVYTLHVDSYRWFKEHINDPKYLRITYRMNESEYKQLKSEEIFIQKFLKDTKKINDRKKIIDEAYNSIVKSSFAKKYRNRIFMRCLARKGIKSELAFMPIKRKQDIDKRDIYAGISVDKVLYDLYFDTKIPITNVKALKEHVVKNRLNHENKPRYEDLLENKPFN